MNYFFVSQSKTYKEEHPGKFLWAPNGASWHHQNMANIKQGDAIIQYKNGEIVGIAIALRDCYPSVKPSDKSFNTWASKGFKVDVEQYHFITPVKLNSVKDELSNNQPKTHAPLNKNGSVNQIYLADANEEMVNTVLKQAQSIDQSPAQFEIVKKIREILKIEAKPILPKEKGEKMQANNSLQKIFFGAPGTGKSYKVNSILPNESVWNMTGEERKSLFEGSDVAKKGHYTSVLSNEVEFGGNVWNINELSLLEKKLPEVDSNNNVSDPKHSALRAYINFLKEYKFEQKVFRTTFHPDYDYAQFVGAYKPKKDDEEKITYSFVPQVFAKAYVKAWSLFIDAGRKTTPENQVYLVIEEINRGNCAQIFGDIFQLLDRVSDGSDKGFSQYSIDADCDFAEWLKEDSILKTVWSEYETKVGEGKLKLPPNILATMNTSDQSLFPMDSAFKRRFDWEYVPIKYAKDADCGEDWNADEFKIVIGDSMYMWLDFLKKVNVDIDETTHSEDKQMGEFFIKPKRDDLKISFDEFRSKVLFYLWDSVYKDETERQAVFHFPYGDGDGKINSVTFQSLFGKDAEAIVNKIMENLNVEKVTA